MPVAKKKLYENFQRAMDDGDAALFVGAGLSMPAGFVSWKELLRDIAEELGLNVDEETDLISLAQYHVNKLKNRGDINQKLVEEFTRNAASTRNHELMARLPVSCVWTPNYDHLVENAFEAAGRRVEKKVTQSQLATTKPRRDVVVYKMHGDVDSPDSAVLTKSDYERYDASRSLFSTQLRGDLVSNTFLFLGVSFSDPNLAHILSRVSGLMGESKRNHFWLTKDAKSDPGASDRDKLIQPHRIDDLKTYGIQTVLMDSYDEITEVLEELNRRVHRRGVLVSGSAKDYAPMGEERVRRLLRRLAGRLVKERFNVVCGMGYGIGDAVALGAMEVVYASPTERLDERTVLRPFPQPGPGEDVDAVWAHHRQELVKRSGAVVYVLGNREVGGVVGPAPGMLEEFEMAQAQGLYHVPIGVTGHAAGEIWRTLNASLASYYKSHADAVRPMFDVLGDTSATDEEIERAVVGILKLVCPR
jgi:hypothetical protein